jgi:hypothetical protein
VIERGVRSVNTYQEEGEAHSDVTGSLGKSCGGTDQASTVLVKGLKQRGLLDGTLVIWGGAPGRTPIAESGPVLPSPSAVTITRRR